MEYLRAPIEVSPRNWRPKTYGVAETESGERELQRLVVFRPANELDIEVRPNWFLFVNTKGKRPRHRLIPMNGPVRAALQKVINSHTTGIVFDYKQTGVSEHASTRFRKASDRARIPFGLTVEGGVIWHDLRRTFATELRGRQVHEYDIADLLGHTIQSVTGTYARSTPDALEDAVNRLTEPRGTVIQFKRRLIESVTILAASSLWG